MRYAARIWNEDGWWLTEIPALGLATTQGKNLDELYKMSIDLIALHLEAQTDQGKPWPSPDTGLPMSEADEEWVWIQIPLRMEAPLRIRKERREAGLTMQQAAERVGVALGTYQRWEDYRKSNATLDTLERVATALGRRVELQFL